MVVNRGIGGWSVGVGGEGDEDNLVIYILNQINNSFNLKQSEPFKLRINISNGEKLN